MCRTILPTIVSALAVLGVTTGSLLAGAVGAAGAKPLPPPKPIIHGSFFATQQRQSFWGVQDNLQYERDRLQRAKRPFKKYQDQWE
jgi:hypothetical protein